MLDNGMTNGFRANTDFWSNQGATTTGWQSTSVLTELAIKHSSWALATIVPLDASQPANRTATRVPTARGLLMAWQLTTDRAAELSAGDRGGFCQGGGRGEGNGGGVIFNEKAPRLFEQYGQERYYFALSKAIFDRITEQGASQRCHVSY